MGGETWKRPALEILLKLYKENSILYDMRHPMYYNKNERKKALINILDLIEDHRPGTTINDILRKIQLMRTQFGQELNKVQKSRKKGVEHIPTVWWYRHLSFLRLHIKRRLSLEDKVEEDYKSSAAQPSDDENYESDGAYEQYELDNDGSSDIVYEIQSSSRNSNKRDSGGETKLLLKQEATPSKAYGSTKETVYELTNNNTLVPKRKIEVISMQELPPLEKAKNARRESTTEANTSGTSMKNELIGVAAESERSRSLGQFVSAQIASLKDDYLFYSTQMEVLNIINKAQLEQLQLDRHPTK